MKKISVLFLAALLAASPVFAQNVSATAKIFSAEATLGDEIRLVLQVERPKKFIIDTPDAKINLSPFEIKRVEVLEAHRGTNRVQETYVLVLTAFELGDLKVPAFAVHYHTDMGKAEQILTDPVDVKIKSVGKKPTDKEDIRPIKGPVKFSLKFIREWLLGCLAAILKVFLIVKIIRRRRKQNLDPESLLLPAERAGKELERLNAKGYLEEQKIKEYYTELSNILRRYFERQHAMIALESTTDEILSELKKKDFVSGVTTDSKDVLQACDLVKFAKEVPSRSLATDLSVKILSIVERTKPVAPVEKKK